jgi:hypothetical protein
VYVGGKNTGNINTGTQVDTGGGAYVRGNVNAGGDFIGREKTVQGDRITTGDVSGAGLAIGRGARAGVTQGISPRELESLFAPLLAAVGQHAPADQRQVALQQVQVLKAEVVKGEKADDSNIAKIVDGLAELVPKAVGAIVSTFATPILSGVVGPVTRYVLDRLKGR